MSCLRPSSHVERLPPEGASPGRARRVVERLLVGAGLEELAEVAVLLVSETVTNAVLHAATELELRCTMDGPAVRIEVRDGSSVLPGLRSYGDEATTGRGVGLVALLATAWGVEPHPDGKTVWFTVGGSDPVAASGDPAGSSGALGPPEPPGPTGFTVRFEHLPVRLVRASLQYGDAVLRELALAAHAGGPGRPLWQGTTIDLAPVLEPVDAALSAGIPLIDVDVELPAGAGGGALARLDLVELADRMAAEGGLLCPPALPEIVACRHWLLGEITSQERGAAPVPWQLPEELGSPAEATGLGEQERTALEALTGCQVVSDEANRIVFASDEAAELLGWEPGELTGRRVTVIVPPALREAHLAGFARYLVTRTPALIGRQARVPARRRDGSEVLVDLLLEEHRGSEGHRGFRAVFTPVPPASG